MGRAETAVSDCADSLEVKIPSDEWNESVVKYGLNEGEISPENRERAELLLEHLEHYPAKARYRIGIEALERLVGKETEELPAWGVKFPEDDDAGIILQALEEYPIEDQHQMALGVVEILVERDMADKKRALTDQRWVETILKYLDRCECVDGSQYKRGVRAVQKLAERELELYKGGASSSFSQIAKAIYKFNQRHKKSGGVIPFDEQWEKYRDSLAA